MPGHYVFVRCWVGFTNAFPFKRFNCLPDLQIVDAIERYARDWLRKNKPAVREEIRRQKTKLLAAAKHRARSAIPVPGRAARPTWKAGIGSVSVDPRMRGPKPSLGVRVAQLVGWAHVPSKSFGDPSPSPRIFLTSLVEDLGDAEQIACALQTDCRDSGLGEQLVLHFGVVPVSDFSPAEEARAKLFVKEIRAGKTFGARWDIGRLLEPIAAQIEAEVKEIRARDERIGEGGMLDTSTEHDGPDNSKEQAKQQTVEVPPASKRDPRAPKIHAATLAKAILFEEPDISPTNLAKQVGVSPGTLYTRTARWKDVRATLLARGDTEAPQGFKDKDGNIEAWYVDRKTDEDP